MKTTFFLRLFTPMAVLCTGLVPALRAWDSVGHGIVNELALASLPADFPPFVHEPANTARIAFLAGEPDRWSHALDLPIKHYNWPDHYCDLEMLTDAGLDLQALPSFRYDFVMAFAAGRAAHPDKFPAIDPAKDTDHTREWPGFLQWTVTEYYGKLKAGFSSLKVYEEAGTPEEIANARADIVYLMGIMGHYVGDSAQPLHLTVNHNGWVGPNPRNYTTWQGFHSWIDGGFIAKAGIQASEIAPRVTPAKVISLAPRPDGRDPVFVAMMDFMLEQSKLVEPLYQMEQAGKLNHDATPPSAEGRTFIDGQLLKGGEMLGAIWLTAWRAAPPDAFLRGQVLNRHAAAAGAPAAP